MLRRRGKLIVSEVAQQPKILGRGLLGALMWASLQACGGSSTPQPEHAPAGAPGGACEVSWSTDAPALDEAPPLEWPRTQLWVDARVPVARVVQELQRQVPEHLARNRTQSVGAAGRATYSVKRLQPRIEERNGHIEVHVPIQATVDVCKPFGRTCIKYGHCEPAFLATFRVPNSVGREYRIDAPRASLEATRRCVIGIDATPQILREARRELGSVETQLARSLPELASPARTIWKALHTPVPVTEVVEGSAEAAKDCFRFVPQGYTHAPARLEDKHLLVGVGLSGRLTIDSCSTQGELAPLPPLQTIERRGFSSEVWVPQLVDFHELAAAVEEQLSMPSGSELTSIEVRAHGSRVALRLRLEGTHCGETWLSAQPQIDTQGLRLRLDDVRSEAAHSGPEQSAIADLAQSLGNVQLALAPPTERARELLHDWLDRAQRAAPELNLTLNFAPPKNGQARVHSGGILATVALEPSVSVALR